MIMVRVLLYEKVSMVEEKFAEWRGGRRGAGDEEKAYTFSDYDSTRVNVIRGEPVYGGIVKQKIYQ